MVLLVLAGCQDSGPFALDGDVEKGPAFELFDGGWAAVHANGLSGFPNLLHNGGFEAGFSEGWIPLAPAFPPPNVSTWTVTAAAANNGAFGLRGSVVGALGLEPFILLQRSVDLPDEATIKLAWSHRYRNFSGPPIWSSTLYKVQLVVPGDPLPVTVWDGADLGAPAVSGGGATPSYERVEVDISGLRNTSGIRLIFVAQTPDEFSLDLDDVEIFVVPGGGDPNPVDFTALTVTDAKVKIHKKRKKD